MPTFTADLNPMSDLQVYFNNIHNLEDVLKEHPEYTRVYFKTSTNNGRLVIGLDKHSGDELYLVSNKDYNDLDMYLRSVEYEVPKKKEAEREPKVDLVKKTKQQDLFSFFKKTGS